VPSESPVSPVQPVHPANKNSSKSQLPDVQEEPLEREEEDCTAIPDYQEPESGLYDCLCMLADIMLLVFCADFSQQATSRVDTATSLLKVRQSTRTCRAISTTISAFSVMATSTGVLDRRRGVMGRTLAFRAGAPGLARG
jgi:hypothetical protein